ncbi:hypothetical protein B5C26_14490 [Photorhabdus luminescens]|nr:hypothetical protein B5C26_14490 [Photorhabdus luminescens]
MSFYLGLTPKNSESASESYLFVLFLRTVLKTEVSIIGSTFGNLYTTKNVNAEFIDTLALLMILK